jgi:ribosomal protein S18 acetylase RimI-like enzyme
VSVTIRQIERSVVSQVADVHLQAFTGYMNTRIGRRYVRSFIEWFRRANDAIALAAIVDGTVAGYVVGAPIGYQQRMNRDLLLVAASGLLLHPWVFLEGRFRRQVSGRLANLMGRQSDTAGEPDLPQPTMCLVGIGVSRDMQGRQIGSLLMHAFECEARRRGARSLSLSVYKENTAARQLYEKRRWSPWDHAADETMEYYLVLSDRLEEG